MFLPRRLVDLSEEVLDTCIEELVPPLSEHRYRNTLWDTPIKFPLDILNLRLTSRLFCRLASPWAWRRIHIRLGETASPENPDAVGNWSFFVDQPALAAHVRFLVLRSNASVSDDTLIAALLALMPAIRMMRSLRVVILDTGIALYTEDVRKICAQVCTELLSKTRVHTFSAAWPAVPRAQERSLANIRHLCIFDTNWATHVLPMIPQLEALSLYAPSQIDTKALPIPWGTLREIETLGVENWTNILENFVTWRKKNPTVHSPLAEISIVALSISSDILHEIFKGFQGHPLRRLALFCGTYVDLLALHSLVAAFPLLEDLQLFTDLFHVNWEDDLDDIATTLGKLRRLTHLRCYYIGDNVENDEELEWMLPHIVSALGGHSSSLSSIQFFYSSDNVFKFYGIKRDNKEQYDGYYEVDHKGVFSHWSNALHTSSWTLHNSRTI